MNKLLRDYKQFKAFDSDLAAVFGRPLIQAQVAESDIEIVKTEDVINAIKKFRSNEISMETLVAWVNTLWFTDLYDYDDDECDSIASVMDYLEELDEEGVSYTDEEYDRMIAALKNNTDYIRWDI